MKYIQLIISTLALLLVSSSSQAQDFYVLGERISDNYKVYKWNQNTNALELEFDFDALRGCYDIAISPNGDFYGIAQLGAIIKIDPDSGTSINIGVYPVPQVHSSLVCSNDSKLYSMNGSGQVVMYDLIAGTTAIVGNVTPHYPTGDLAYYKGNLIFQSTNDSNIKAYNLANDSLVNIFCVPAYDEFRSLWGNSTLFSSCELESFVAVSSEGNFYQFNFDSLTIQNLQVDISITDTLVYFYGTATTNEHYGSLCPSVQLDDIDCSTVSIDESELNSQVQIYPNPVTDKMIIVTDAHIDQVEIFDIHGKIVQRIHSPEQEIYIDTLSTGMYIVKISTPSGILTKRVIK